MQLSATALEKPESRAMPWRRPLACIVFSILLQGLVAIVLIALYASQPQHGALRVAAAQELPDPDLTHIVDAAWQALELPARLCRADCNSRYKVYRIQLGANPARAESALYVKMYDGSMSAYLNGARVGQTGSMRDPIADMTYQPAYFEIPDSLWSATSNVLDIVVASLVPEGGRLTAPFVGNSESLRFSHRIAHGLTVDSLAIVNGILLIFLFAAVLLYFAADRDHLFIWFALLILFSAARNLNVLFPEWPASDIGRSGIYLCATLGVLLAAGGFISRLVATRISSADTWLVAAWLPASLLIAVGLHVDMWTTWMLAVQATRLLTLTLGTWLLVRFVIFSRTLPVAVQASIFALLGAALTLMLHDTIGSAPPRILMFQMSNLAAIPIVLSFCIVLAHRYREYVTRISIQNKLLTTAVENKEAELANSYEQLAKARDAQVLADERQRIMQDMHDGVGGRLAALLQRLRLEPARDTALASELQASLNDLRLIIDSLDATAGDNLGFALGTFRQRVEPWLQENHIDLHWTVTLNHEYRFGPERTLQIYRILQESLNNVVRHASARQVRIRIYQTKSLLHLTIDDDGNGMPAEPPQGRGLEIMRRRVDAMNGEITIDSHDRGVSLSIRLPLDPP